MVSVFLATLLDWIGRVIPAAVLVAVQVVLVWTSGSTLFPRTLVLNARSQFIATVHLITRMGVMRMYPAIIVYGHTYLYARLVVPLMMYSWTKATILMICGLEPRRNVFGEKRTKNPKL